MSKIEWTGDTWNPLIGCDKVSAGCKNCYAIQTAWIRQHNPKMAEKYAGVVEKTPAGKLNWTGKVNFHLPSLLKPLKKRESETYFVNSMSDLFHESVSFDIIDLIFIVMKKCSRHTFQILTKRPERMLEYFSSDRAHLLDEAALKMPDELSWYIPSTMCYVQKNGIEGWPLKNVWIGVSVEDQKAANERIPLLLQVPAAVRFLSCEPLLGSLDLTKIRQEISPGYFGDCLQWYHKPYRPSEADYLPYPKIDWVICGGESGPCARPMHPDWARTIRDDCKSAGVYFFFKQWGNYTPFEPTAQPPFHRNCADGTEWDGHELNFIDSESSEAGKFYCYRWMDPMDAIIFNDANKASDCSYLKTGKKDSGRLLDGREWNEMPE